jgi:sulfur carrier protein
MELSINGEKISFEKNNLSIAGLLVLNKVESPDMVSVQLNGEIIDRTRYDQVMLADRDEVDFLYFMGGGNLL